MIAIDRKNCYNKKITESLAFLLELKINDFAKAAKLAELYFFIKNKSHAIKTALYTQVRAHGGQIIPNAKKPPYYQFENDSNRIKFDEIMTNYLNNPENIDFDEIILYIDDNIYITIPAEIKTNLKGIVSIR